MCILLKVKRRCVDLSGCKEWGLMLKLVGVNCIFGYKSSKNLR